MNSSEYIKRAVGIIQEAIDNDTNGNYEVALELYTKGLSWFEMAVKYEKNNHRKVAIEAKMREYMNRAEVLSESMMETNATATSTDQIVTVTDTDVKWSDVAGLETAKIVLKEAIILPKRFPDAFIGKRKAWGAILFYGPPGTGKTFLAKAVATESGSTFFSVTSADLVSKFIGESAQKVKKLFEMAREHKPSIVFVDEIEALCGARGGSNESESAKQVMQEFLTQMDGVGKSQRDIVVIGATNLPWDLDSAILRRFQKRIYIPLPDAQTRATIFRLSIGSEAMISSENIRRLSLITEGYSGADVKTIVAEALMYPLRTVQTSAFFRKDDATGRMTPCSDRATGAIEMSWEDIEYNNLLVPDVTIRNFIQACSSTKSSIIPGSLPQYDEWTQEMGVIG